MGSSLVDLFARRGAEFPERVAVVDDDRALTYGELDRESDLWAGALRSTGAGPGALVGLCADRSTGLVVMMLGILKTGAAYVPLDPAYPPARLGFVVSDTGCRVVAGQDRFAGLFTGTGVTFVSAPATSPAPPVPVDGDAPAYVIHTSGSTGTPKGVVVSHHNVLRLFESTGDDFGLGPRDVWTLFHSFAFDFSVWEIWGALLFGGRLVVVPYATSRSPEEFWRLLKRERVTVLNQTPTAFRQLSAAARDEGFAGHSLRLVVFGGERLDPAALRDWFDHHGDVSPRLVNMYGITETTVHVTARTMRAADLDRADSPIGEPLRDLRVHLLDADLRPVADGEKGEIFVGGPGVALGYLGRPELTAARFLPDHLGGGGRLYRSGDLASHAADGELVFHGRADDQVQLRGFRVELGEVEHALASAPGVGQCAVVLRERDGHAELVGFVTGGAVTSTALRAAAAEVLPAHLVPRAFVTVDALPMTANGKVDRAALSALDVRGRPAELPYSAPKGEVEGAVADIWAEVLGVRPVGRHDPFTGLGGDSLHATGVLGRLRRRFEPALSLGDLFAAGTPAAVAALLSERTAVDPAEPSPGDPTALSSNQANLLFLAELSPQASSAYNITAAVRVHGDLDTARLAQAVDEAVARHESLRTGFTLGADGPVRSVGTAPRGLARLVRVPDEPEAARRARSLAARPFDLARPPLLRAEIMALPDGDHLLVVVVSHLVADGWSVDVLSRELADRYNGTFREDGPARTFTDHVAWERSVDPSAGLTFWRTTLDGAPVALELPADHPRPPEPAFAGRRLTRFAPADLRQAVAALARAENATPYAVLLAAYGQVVADLAGVDDVVVGSPSSGRPGPELDDVVGYFANTLPIRLTAAPGSTFRHAVRAAHRQALAAVDHQYVPFDRIVAEVVGRDRDRSHRPLVRVAFTHHGTTGFEPRLDGLRTRMVDVDAGTSRFDLLVEVREAPDGTAFSAEYDSALFTESTANAMLDGYLRFLRTAVDSPDTVLSRRSAAPRSEAAPAPVDRTTPPGQGSDTERVLAGIWAEVLRLPAVSPTDDFFALGGDSMTALAAVGAARARGLDVTVAQLFRTPTVSGLAHVSRTAPVPPADRTALLSPADRAALPDDVEDAYPVSALQMGIAFHCEMADDPTLYHDLVSVRLRGPLRPDALRRALRDLAARHDVLRTSFDLGAYSEPLQLVHRSVEVAPTVREATSADPHEALRRWWATEWQRGFDLGSAPLWRCHVLTHADGTHHLSVTAHHTILDGWSFASLMTELLLRYDERDLPLAPPDVRYHDFVRLERADLRSAEIRSHWTATTRPAPPLPPTAAGSRPPRMDPDAVVTVPSGLSEEVRRVALALGVPTKCVYLAAHVRAVRQVLDVDEVATGVVVNGRPESPGADQVLGLFLNTLPLRVRPAAMGDHELIAAVAAFERDSAPFRRFPLAEVQRDHGAPLFHVRFNFADFHVLDRLADLTTVEPVDWWSSDRNEIPLSVEVDRNPTTADFEIRVRVDEALLPADTAHLVADGLLAALGRIAGTAA